MTWIWTVVQLPTLDSVWYGLWREEQPGEQSQVNRVWKCNAGLVPGLWSRQLCREGTLGGVSFWCQAALLCKSQWWILHRWVMLSYVTVAVFILKSWCGGGNLRASNISTLWHFLCPHSFVWSFTWAGPTRRGQGGTRVVSRGSEWKHVFSRKNK